MFHIAMRKKWQHAIYYVGVFTIAFVLTHATGKLNPYFHTLHFDDFVVGIAFAGLYRAFVRRMERKVEAHHHIGNALQIIIYFPKESKEFQDAVQRILRTMREEL